MRKLSSIDKVKYLEFYMNLLPFQIKTFGMYSANYFILLNKILILIEVNSIDLETIKSVLDKSVLKRDFGFTLNHFFPKDRFYYENLN